MSREYVVLFVEPHQYHDIDGQPAEVFMRFTERPDDDFLIRLAKEKPGRRVYCLMGASTWYEEDRDPS